MTVQDAHEPDEVGRLVAYLRNAGRLDGESRQALYRRLETAFREAIRSSVLPPGAAIPGERELADRLSLSRVTVRKAIKALVHDRLMVQRHGARTSVAERVEKPVSIFTSFSEDMQARGRQPGATWLRRSVGRALPAELSALELVPGSEVNRLHRLRTADGVPMAIETSVVPAVFLPPGTRIGESLYAALSALGHEPVRAVQRMRATVADREEARLLGIEAGAALLTVERRVFLKDGRIVEFCESRYRGDSYDFLVDLHRQEGRG